MVFGSLNFLVVGSVPIQSALDNLLPLRRRHSPQAGGALRPGQRLDGIIRRDGIGKRPAQAGVCFIHDFTVPVGRLVLQFSAALHQVEQARKKPAGLQAGSAFYSLLRFCSKSASFYARFFPFLPQRLHSLGNVVRVVIRLCLLRFFLV